jgi:hypothetical protein
MKWKIFLFGFVMNKNPEYLNVDIKKITHFFPLTHGYDERYDIFVNETNYESRDLLLKIKKSMIQSELLQKLLSQSIGVIEKQALIEEYEKTFGENKITPDINLGGLWKDFNT